MPDSPSPAPARPESNSSQPSSSRAPPDRPELVDLLGLLARGAAGAAAPLDSLILAALADGRPVDQQDLLIRMAGARSPVRAALARLEERGLIERRKRPADRRRIDVSITPAGLRASDPAAPGPDGLLAPGELETLRSILGKVAGRAAAPGRRTDPQVRLGPGP